MASALAVCLACFLQSCDKDSDAKVTVTLSLYDESVTGERSSQFISVETGGSWTLKLTDGVSWASVAPSSGTGSSKNVILSYEANATGAERSVEITLVSGGKTVTKTLVQGFSNGGGEEGGGEGGSTASSGWLELPETPTDDAYDFFTHDMKIGNVKTRNYSYYWDYDNLVARWVAYPMSSWNIGGNVSRTNAWALDPLLPASKQPVLYRGFSEGNHGWYARGHQCASADRLANYDANAQTFYGTNMTPQINDNFNSAIWATLEAQLRTWANRSDTVYVVTGCLTEGSAYYALDNDGKKVTVPTAYYKAILRYSKNSTIGFNGFLGCAFYFEHKTYSSSSINSSLSMSIDALEKKIGIDLFVNLPDKIGKESAAQVEAEDPSKVSWWW